MSSQLKARIALQGDTKDLMNKLQQTKAKAKETSGQIHRGFGQVATPLNRMSALLGGNNEALNSMSGSINGVGSQMGKLAVANPILLGMTALVATAKLAYDELKRSVEDYTLHTEAGMDSLKAHNKALEEAVSFTRRLKEERSGLGKLAEEARQDADATFEIYKSGSTFWQKAIDAVMLMNGQFGKVAERVIERGLDKGLEAYDEVKAAQSELLDNERKWYRQGKLKVVQLRTEAEQQLLIARDKQKSDEERKRAAEKYSRLIAAAYIKENKYLTERHRLIVIANKHSADNEGTMQAIYSAEEAVYNLTVKHTNEKAKILRISNEIDKRTNARVEKLQEEVIGYGDLLGNVRELEESERRRKDLILQQGDALKEAWNLIDGYDWGDEFAEGIDSFDLADMVRFDSEKIRTKTEEMTAAMNDHLNGALADGIAGTIENGIAAAFNPDFSFLDAQMLMFADFAKTLGKMLIAHGVAMEAFKKSFSNPFAAIAGGIGLVASGALIRNFVNKRTKSFNDGGVFNAHYGDQLVARLNPSEMILTPQQQSNLFNMLKMGSNPYSNEQGISEVVFRIGHNELVGTLEQGRRLRHRNG